MSETRIRRDNWRDARAVSLLYADEDSDRGFLARQVVRLIDDFCVCAETSTRNCPVHAPVASNTEDEPR